MERLCPARYRPRAPLRAASRYDRSSAMKPLRRQAAQGRYGELSIATPMRRSQLCAGGSLLRVLTQH